MKKISMLMMFVVMIGLLLGACNNAEPTASTSQGENGKNVAQGVTDKEILVGHFGPQTGPVAEYDKVRKGLDAYFSYINDNGGVNGRKIKLIAYDDQYQPAKTVQVAQKLIKEDKVFSLIYPLGTANLNAILPTLKETGIPVTGGGTGADEFANPPIKNLFMGTFNYKKEANIFLDYVVNKMHAKKIAIAYQNDDFGKQGSGALKESISKFTGVNIVKEVTFLATDQDLSSQAQQLKQANPDVIIMISTPIPAASLRQEMYKIKATNIPYIVSQTGGADKHQFKLAGENVWAGTITAKNYLDPAHLTNPEKDKYLEYIKEKYGEENIGGLTQVAWTQGQIFVEALKRCGDNLTWENFIKQMETFNDWKGSFYPQVTNTTEDHTGTSTLFIMEAKDGELQPIKGAEANYNSKTGEVTYK